jgi:hypothetical protein
VFGPAQEVLLREVLATGLQGDEAATAFTAIEFSLGAFVLLEHSVPAGYQMRGLERWGHYLASTDPNMKAALEEGIYVDAISEYALAALVHSLIGARRSRQ